MRFFCCRFLSAASLFVMITAYASFPAYKALNSNTYFIRSGAAGSKCTLEEPCGSLNQKLVEQAGKNARFYLAGGHRYDLGGRLVLSQGQSLFGRTQDFKKVSAGNERPELIGGLTIQGKNHAQPVILQALQLVNGAEVQRFGVDIEKARDVRIEDVRIGQRDFEKNFARGIQISGSTDIQIQNSSIYASSTVLDGYGLLWKETPPISSNIEVRANRFDVRAPGHYARAVYAKDAASLKLNANIFDVRSEGQEAYGVLAANKASLSLMGNHFKVFSKGNAAHLIADVGGLHAQGEASLTLSGNAFDLRLEEGSSGVIRDAIGAVTIGNASLNLDSNNTFNIYSALNGTGVKAYGKAPLSINGSAFAVTAKHSFGLRAQGGVAHAIADNRFLLKTMRETGGRVFGITGSLNFKGVKNNRFELSGPESAEIVLGLYTGHKVIDDQKLDKNQIDASPVKDAHGNTFSRVR